MTTALRPAIDFIRHAIGAARLSIATGATPGEEGQYHTIDSHEDVELRRRLCVDTAGRYVDADGNAITTGAGIVDMYVPRERTIVCGALGGSLTFRPRRVPVRLDGGPAAALDVRATGGDREWTVTVEAFPGVTTLGAIAAAFAASQAPGGVAGTVRPDALVECVASDPADVYDGSLFSTTLKSPRPAPIVVPGQIDADGHFVPASRDSTLETVYQSPANVACAAAVVTALCPYVDIEHFTSFRVNIYNCDAANPIDVIRRQYSTLADGTGAPAGSTNNSFDDTIAVAAGNSTMLNESRCGAAGATGIYPDLNGHSRGYRVSVRFPLGGSARCTILGRRAK